MSGNLRGRFITFEGGEGAGKSTQCRRLAARLTAQGYDVVTTREPGGSPGAEIIREVLLSGAARALGPKAEAALFAAARADHVDTLIWPALQRGAIVLCDRFFDSTRVYQGTAGHVPVPFLRVLERIAVGSIRPDLTLVLDAPAELGQARVEQRRGQMVPDRFEAEDIDFHRRLRRGFRDLVGEEPDRLVLVDASGMPDLVEQRIWAVVTQRLGHTPSGPFGSAA